MSDSRRYIVYIQLALGMAIFGSGTPISKIVTSAFPVFVASGFRMLVAALLLSPFVWRERHTLKDLTRRDTFALAGITLVGMLLFSVFMLLGMQEVSGVVGSIIMSMTPAVTAVGAFLFLNNTFGWRRITAIILAVAGVLVLQVSSSGDGSGSGQVLLGSLLVFLAVCSEAAYTLLGRVATDNLKPTLIAGVTSLAAMPVFFLLALLRGSTIGQPGLGDWAALLWWGGGTLALGTYLWYTGVSKVPGSIAAGFMGVMPVSALVLSYVLLGETFEPIHLVGFGIVFSGVLLIAWAHARESQEAQGAG